MSVYFCSDLHGEYESFLRLLDEINFSGGDQMFVLGDFIDKGKNSIELARLLMEENNFKVLLGNHEHFFLRHYAYCVDEYERGEIDDLWQAVGEYFTENPEPFLPEVADYIESLPYYFEEEDFICVHAGLELDDRGRIKPLSEQDSGYMLFDRGFGDDVIPVNSKTVLFGHTPVRSVGGVVRIKKTLRHGLSEAKSVLDYCKIQLDLGTPLTGVSGCIRLEDLKEFYVKKTCL